jgi:hypothetical protein
MFSDGAVIQMFLHLASILLLWHVSKSEAVLFEISRRLAISKNLDQFCRALYQLHLVKAEVARRFIPPELKLVQAFGYTLGGLYLAHYDSSPAGIFDEMVVLAGIVWNPPTSCAWASRVLVNSKEARDHGIKVWQTHDPSWIMA